MYYVPLTYPCFFIPVPPPLPDSSYFHHLKNEEISLSSSEPKENIKIEENQVLADKIKSGK